MSRDAEWIKKIYAKNKKHLGSFDLFMSWQKYMTGKGGKFEVAIQSVSGSPVGFVRYAWMNKYTAYVVHEIGVFDDFQGLGYGAKLLTQVPIPVLLKCNMDNLRGNEFYKSMGMNCAGKTYTRKGVEQLIWTKTNPW